MAVMLYAPGKAPGAERYDAWACIADAPTPRSGRLQRAGLAAALEDAFDSIAEDWWALARELGSEPTATLAHAPGCSPNASDLGEMLAWTRLVETWSQEKEVTLVICADPWLFRHLARRPGVEAGRAPPLRLRQARLALRGIASRSRVAARMSYSSLILWAHRGSPATAGHVIVTRGHPASTPQDDAYFAGLMAKLPELGRMLHVDTPIAQSRRLFDAAGRTGVLRGWGNPLSALALPFARWRPSRSVRRGRHGWLVRRAAAIEGGGGHAAAARWQEHCQRRWIGARRARLIATAWENHAWQRALTRTCRNAGVATLGYQHSAIGRQLLNFAPAGNSDGLASIPDCVVCNGPATQDQLAHWGIPAERLQLGGALRMPRPERPVGFRRTAPVYVALPFDPQTADALVAAAIDASARGFRFIVKAHPIYPVAFPETERVSRTETPLAKMDAVGGVLFANTTVGLEALLMGLPVLRFRTPARLAVNILPAGVVVDAVDADGLVEALEGLAKPAAPARDSVFSEPDFDLWIRLFDR